MMSLQGSAAPTTQVPCLQGVGPISMSSEYCGNLIMHKILGTPAVSCFFKTSDKVWCPNCTSP